MLSTRVPAGEAIQWVDPESGVGAGVPISGFDLSRRVDLDGDRALEFVWVSGSTLWVWDERGALPVAYDLPGPVSALEVGPLIDGEPPVLVVALATEVRVLSFDAGRLVTRHRAEAAALSLLVSDMHPRDGLEILAVGSDTLELFDSTLAALVARQLQPSESLAGPAAHDPGAGLVYATKGSRWMAFDAETLRTRWRSPDGVGSTVLDLRVSAGLDRILAVATEGRAVLLETETPGAR